MTPQCRKYGVPAILKPGALDPFIKDHPQRTRWQNLRHGMACDRLTEREAAELRQIEMTLLAEIPAGILEWPSPEHP